MKPSAPFASNNVATNAVSGTLTAAFRVADVPLHGPGTWNISANRATLQTLQCAQVIVAVISVVTVGPGSTCQFEISLAPATTDATWLLTPVP